MPNVCTTTNGISANVCYYYDQGTNQLGQTQKGFRTKMVDVSGSAAWTYSLIGQIVTESRTIAGIAKTFSYSYNLDGSLKSITYPSGRVVTYAVGNAQRPVSVTDSGGTQYVVGPTTPPEYAVQGSLASAIYGKSSGFAGLTETRSYGDELFLDPSSIKAASSTTTVFNLGPCDVYFSFTTGCTGSHRCCGNRLVWTLPSTLISGSTDGLDTGRNQNISYDWLNRVAAAVTQATSGTDCWGQSYAIDPLGNLTGINITQCSAGGLSTTANGYNQLMGFGYDKAGNMTNDGRYSYVYDAENRITTANAVNQIYDGNGLRVEKSSGTLYWRSVAGVTLAETNLSGTPTSDYIFFAGRRIARVDSSGNVYYYFADHLGTTRTITNSTGAVCYDADFTPYGQEIPHTNTCPQNYKFTGYERDTETGLDYAFGRHYSPLLGRFMSADPMGGSVGRPQSLNRYAYVFNNPNSLTDQSGLDACPGDASACFYFLGGFLGGGFGGDLGGFPDGFNGVNPAVLAGWNYNAKTGWAMLSPAEGADLFIYAVAGQANRSGPFSPPTISPEATYTENKLAALAMVGQNLSQLESGKMIVQFYAYSGAFGYAGFEAGLFEGEEFSTLSRVYRVFGGDSTQFGRPLPGGSFTPYNPSEVPYYAEQAGLPIGNNAQYVLQGELPLSYPVTVQPAAAIIRRGARQICRWSDATN